MSLRFVLGGSGAGKSTAIYGEILKRAKIETDRNFFVVVPDQFTMQTQKELIVHTENTSHGILNIDVLSFGRLSHRIFEEVGKKDVPVLDDTGKSLILRKVAEGLKEDLPYLGSHLKKQGYVHEVKSAISEFMQYGISVEDVDKLINYAEKRGNLYHKLRDLQVLYRGFTDYIRDKYITTEETLDVLCNFLHKSGLIQDSVIVFDGFTGFTPIQYRVISTLLSLTYEVIVTVTINPMENPFEMDGEQKLFHLSKKTIRDIIKLAKKEGVERGEDLILSYDDAHREGAHRFSNNPVLAHLEQSLFRYPVKAYPRQDVQKSAGNLDVAEYASSLQIFAASTIREEVRQMSIAIEKLIRDEGYAYRDIAVICGDLGSYADQIETQFAMLSIPCYVDRTKGIVLNPLTEYIKSAMELFILDFSYESVFRYLRSGLAGFMPEEVDILENYCIAAGIRGREKWSRQFIKKPAYLQEDLDLFWRIDALRIRFVDELEPLFSITEKKEYQAGEFVIALYDFLVKNHAAEKLQAYEKKFASMQDAPREREYAQVYRLIMELLEQVMELLREECMTLKEFKEILEAGFAEIEVGSIPQNVDRVLVGDMERTRLKEVRAVFFMGINDGNIPKSGTAGGIISDIDREYLCGSELELAPSPRQKMYIQRLYLYLNMTKPSEKLYLSFAKLDGEGKSLRPAYLIDVMKELFPGIRVEEPELQDMISQIYSPEEGLPYLAKSLREFAVSENVTDVNKVYTLYQAYKESENHKEVLQLLQDAAFLHYRQGRLSKEVARALYGQTLLNSVSRIETYAACAYRQFLQYGLTLKERKEFCLESIDLGNIFHQVLEGFSHKVEQSDYTWFDFTKEFAESAVDEVLNLCTAEYGATILYDNARNFYALKRIRRILLRTVDTLQYQLKKGSFTPMGYELSFQRADDLESVNIALSEYEKMRLLGRIDRVDTVESEDHIFVKIIDYKSGNKKFDIAALYYGLQLQLVVYMNAALEQEKKKHPDKHVVPAAMLYYHVADDCAEADASMSVEEVTHLLREKLRGNGVVNLDEAVLKRLDGECEGKSDVIPIKYNKDGSLASESQVMSEEEMQLISGFVTRKMAGFGKEILDGKITVNPYEKGQEKACTYCPFQGVCDFDCNTEGFAYRKLKALKQDEVMEKIRGEVGAAEKTSRRDEALEKIRKEEEECR